MTARAATALLSTGLLVSLWLPWRGALEVAGPDSTTKTFGNGGVMTLINVFSGPPPGNAWQTHAWLAALLAAAAAAGLAGAWRGGPAAWGASVLGFAGAIAAIVALEGGSLVGWGAFLGVALAGALVVASGAVARS